MELFDFGRVIVVLKSWKAAFVVVSVDEES